MIHIINRDQVLSILKFAQNRTGSVPLGTDIERVGFKDFFSQVSLDKDKEEIVKLAVHFLSRVEQ